jgi:predicted O-methyltransferase YrrM
VIDIPTALTELEATTLAQLAHGKNVLEVGSLLGFSTITMAATAEHVWSVDPHEGYPEDDPKPTFTTFIGNLQLYGVDERVTAIKDTDNWLLSPGQDLPVPIDFAFIDATGHYADTIRIMERAYELMHPDAQIMAVHDYGILAWPGAGEAVRDFCTQRGLNFGVVDTLALVRLGHPDD